MVSKSTNSPQPKQPKKDGSQPDGSFIIDGNWPREVTTVKKKK